MPTPDSRWDPSEVLDVDPHSTCVGHAKTQGRRCRNIIAADNRREAEKILRRMGKQDVQTTDFDDRLESLANRLLCRRWHVKDEDQVNSKVKQWKRAIERFRVEELEEEEEEEEEREENARQARRARRRAEEASTRSNVVQEPSTRPSNTHPIASTETPCIAATLESLRQELVSLNERYANALQLASPSAVVSSSSTHSISRTGSDQTSGQPRPDTSAEGNSDHRRSLEVSRRTSAESVVAQPSSTQNEPEEEDNQQESEQTATSPSHSSDPDPIIFSPTLGTGTPRERHSTERSDPEPVARLVSRRPIEGDCSICCEELVGGNDLAWCKAQCGQNFHANCVGIWVASRDEDEIRRGTCPYWLVKSLDILRMKLISFPAVVPIGLTEINVLCRAQQTLDVRLRC